MAKEYLSKSHWASYEIRRTSILLISSYTRSKKSSTSSRNSSIVFYSEENSSGRLVYQNDRMGTSTQGWDAPKYDSQDEGGLIEGSGGDNEETEESDQGEMSDDDSNMGDEEAEVSAW